MKFEKLRPGMVVYDVGRYRMGNTKLSTVGVWHVRIVSVDLATRTVVASWNSNPQKIYREAQITKWREAKPLLIRVCAGYARLATRAEIAAARKEAALQSSTAEPLDGKVQE